MGQLKFGYQSVCWASYEVEQYEVDRIAQQIAEAGFHGVAFAHQLQHFRRVPDLDGVLRNLHLELATLSCSVSYDADDPMPETLARAEYAAARGVKELMVVGGWGPDWCHKSDGQLSRLARNLDTICERFADRGLRTAYHPHLETCCENDHDIDRLLGFSKYTHLCLDNGHFDLTGKRSADLVRQHAARIGLAHVKDFQPAHDTGTGHTGAVCGRPGRFCELGEGELDVAGFLDALIEINFTGWVIVELDRTTRTPLESAHMSANWLRRHGYMT